MISRNRASHGQVEKRIWAGIGSAHPSCRCPKGNLYQCASWLPPGEKLAKRSTSVGYPTGSTVLYERERPVYCICIVSCFRSTTSEHLQPSRPCAHLHKGCKIRHTGSSAATPADHARHLPALTSHPRLPPVMSSRLRPLSIPP